MCWGRWNTASGSCVIVYRMASSRHPANDGEGATLHGGRWNHKGTPVIYSSQSISLCALEVLANSSGLREGATAILSVPSSIVPRERNFC